MDAEVNFLLMVFLVGSNVLGIPICINFIKDNVEPERTVCIIIFAAIGAMDVIACIIALLGFWVVVVDPCIEERSDRRVNCPI